MSALPVTKIMEVGLMSNELEIFNNEEFGSIRTLTENDVILFCASDVAKALGYTNPSKAVGDHCPHVTKREVGVQTGKRVDGSVATQTVSVSFIPEGDIYRLIIRSKLPSAEKFEKWVFDDVLPSIRKHGLYATEDLLANPDLAIVAFTALKEEREKRKELEAVVEEQMPLVSFANKVSNTKDLINMGEMAKLLKDKHIEIGRNRLFAILREEGILMKSNVPYQQYIDRGYFEVKEAVKENNYGNKVFPTTYVTGKGQLFLTKEIQKIFASEENCL